MRIPSDRNDKERFLRLIIDSCMASQEERMTLYEKRRRYFLFGQNVETKVKYNSLKSHIKLVSSFLFSPDGLTYNITPPNDSDDNTIQQFLALQDDWNKDVHDSGIADTFADAVLWALNFDTMVIKVGWNDITKQATGKLVEPSSFGVYREDDTDFSNQPAMNHTFLLDYDEACSRLIKAGRADRIGDLQVDTTQSESGLPAALQQIIVSATAGSNLLTGNIMGTIDSGFEEGAHFTPKVNASLVRFHETWVWDDDAQDWRIFHSLQGPILLSDSGDTIKILEEKTKSSFDSKTNWFLEKTNPFVPITPFTLYNYFWGDCHQEDIIPLQNWSTTRLEQIDEILKRQDDPAKVFSGFQGIADEKAEALGGPGSWVADAMPGAKVEELRPPMPEDLFREFNEITGLMMQASGLTEVTAGKSSGGARGGQQQKQMQITGGGQIRRVAVGLEGALVRLGDIGIRLKMKNDDSRLKTQAGEFLAAQLPDEFSIRVAGHSHSPLFTTETKELASILFKAQAIDQEGLVRLLNPPEIENILHSLKQRQAAAAQQAAMHPEESKKKK